MVNLAGEYYDKRIQDQIKTRAGGTGLLHGVLLDGEDHHGEPVIEAPAPQHPAPDNWWLLFGGIVLVVGGTILAMVATSNH